MQCLKWQKLSLNLFQILTCISSLKKVQEAGFLIFLIDGKAKNKYLKSYEPKQGSKHIILIFLDSSKLKIFFKQRVSIFPSI